MRSEAYRECAQRYLATPRGADATVHAVETLLAFDPALLGASDTPSDDDLHIIRVLIEKLAANDQDDLVTEGT